MSVSCVRSCAREMCLQCRGVFGFRVLLLLCRCPMSHSCFFICHVFLFFIFFPSFRCHALWSRSHSPNLLISHLAGLKGKVVRTSVVAPASFEDHTFRGVPTVTSLAFITMCFLECKTRRAVGFPGWACSFSLLLCADPAEFRRGVLSLFASVFAHVPGPCLKLQLSPREVNRMKSDVPPLAFHFPLHLGEGCNC